MSISTSELQVAEGLADDLDLRSLHYGILLHRRRAVGTAVTEDFEYRALVDANSNPLHLPGILPDDDRIEFERGSGSVLDRRLVRRSAFCFAVSAATGQGVGSLQEVFLIVKPKKGSNLQSALGLKLFSGPGLAAKVCPPEGLPAIRIWSNEEWQDRDFVASVSYDGDLAAWKAALGRAADDVVLRSDGFKVLPSYAEIPRTVFTDGQGFSALGRTGHAPTPLTTVLVTSPAPAPAPEPTPLPPRVPFPPSTTTQSGNTRDSQRGWLLGLWALGLGAAYYLFFLPDQQPEPPSRDQTGRVAGEPAALPRPRILPAPVALTAEPPGIAIERLAQSIAVPVGNSPAERQRLFDPEAGFKQNFGLLTALLASAQNKDTISFDQYAVEMRSARAQTGAWPTESGVERRKFNEQLADLINIAVDAGDSLNLERSVVLSEQFLGTHFGHSTAHLNFSLALSQLGRFAEAQGPAHHAIYFNPDGINGYFALGLSLAGQNKVLDATAAFCAALRKSRYSVKTVNFFNEVAAGRKYSRTPVASTMAAAINHCPASLWGTNLPP